MCEMTMHVRNKLSSQFATVNVPGNQLRRYGRFGQSYYERLLAILKVEPPDEVFRHQLKDLFEEEPVLLLELKQFFRI